MKVLKVVLNVLGIIAASLLSVLLTVVLVAAPVTSAVSSFLQADTLHKVVKEIDYSKLLETIGESSGEGAAIELPGEVVQAIAQTEAVGELMDLYMEEIFSAIDGNTQPVLTTDALLGIVQNNMDEIVEIMNTYMGADEIFTEETTSEIITAVVETEGERIIEMLPKAEDLGLVPSGGDVSSEETIVMAGVQMVRSGGLLMIVILAAAVLSVLIFLLRVMRFKGFMWLGAVYFVAAALSLVVALAVGGNQLSQMLAAATGFGTVTTAVLSVMSAKLMLGAGVLALVAVVFTAAFIVGRIFLKKRKVKKPTEQEIQVA